MCVAYEEPGKKPNDADVQAAFAKLRKHVR
jgi:hypothetical protein